MDVVLLESEWLFALRNALVVARLQQMALKDPLTALGNRRFFDDSFVDYLDVPFFGEPLDPFHHHACAAFTIRGISINWPKKDSATPSPSTNQK